MSDGNPYCPLAVDGQFGPASTRAFQWRCNHDGVQPQLVIDGSFGPNTAKAVERITGCDLDGDLRPGYANNDATRLEHYLVGLGIFVPISGVWDAPCSKGVQLSLNNGSF